MTFARTCLQLRPIVTALNRHKVATALIVLQVALTLAVACNALHIVATRIVHLSRPTGTDEAHLFVIRNTWKNAPESPRLDADIRTDLAALRQAAGVRDAFASEAYPLEGGGGNVVGVKLDPAQTTRPRLALIYFADEHALDTFGTPLAEGRNFRPDEIAAFGPYDKLRAPVVIITRSLADKLFPDTPALGKTVYLPDGPATVIGILAGLQGPYAGSTTRSIDEDSMLVPARYLDPAGTVYLVRTDTTAMAPVIQAAMKALSPRNDLRLLDPKADVVTLAQAREKGYATDRSVSLLMSVLSALLLLATAGGIVGLSSFWVSQRRRQIGVRRSLGATTGDILRYFHAENFLIVGAGVVLGMVLAMVANRTLMSLYELPRMPFYVPWLGAVLLWLLGQAAVWGPARLAAKVPPVVAIRSE